MLSDTPPRPSRRAWPRLAWMLGIPIAAGLIALAATSASGRISPSSVRPAQPPAASSPSPTPPSLLDVGRVLLPDVVTVETERASDEALGTGWLFDDRGDFVTNAHVVAGHLAIRLTDRSDHTHVGVVIGVDPEADIAIVRSSDGFAGTPLAVDAARLGTVPLSVVALASSRATGHADMTADTISALDQDVPLQSGEVLQSPGSPSVYHDMLELEGARVYEGNSGGPVVDAAGRVVGIMTLASPSGPEAFAIPIARVLAELQRFAAQPG